MVFITMVESVYSAVRTDSVYKADYVSSLNRLNIKAASVIVSIHMSHDMVVGCSKHSNEVAGSIKCGNFLTS
jgi:hypothetical protein